MSGNKDKQAKLTHEEREALRQKYLPSRRKLKTASRTFAITENLKRLSGNSTSALDKAARDIAESVQRINEFTEKLSTLGQDGRCPELTRENLQNLNQLYSEAFTQCTALISGTGMSDSTKNSQKFKTYMEMVSMTRRFISADMQCLKTANAKLGSTLPEVMANARSIVLKAENVEFDTVGAFSSTRIPMTVSLPGGKKVKGLFTQKDDFDVVKEFNALFDSIKIHSDLNDLVDSLKNDLKKETTPDELIGRSTYLYSNLKPGEDSNPLFILRSLTSKGNKQIKQTEGYEKAKHLLEDSEDNKELWKKLSTVAHNAAKKYCARSTVNYKSGGITRTNLDTKNSACSVLAAALGRPDLVANSAPVKMMKNGKVVEGTFMEFVEGTDLTSTELANRQHPYYSLKVDGGLMAAGGVSGRPVVKDIFDTEILDYVFGNIDAHGGNIIYDIKSDATGTYLNGIKRIDLDNTFPEVSIGTEGVHNLASVNRMKVISKSMADRINSLDGDALKLMLRNFIKSEANPDGLSEKAVEMTVERLNEVKSRIKYDQKDFKLGTLKVLSDEEFTKYRLREMLPFEYGDEDQPSGTSKDIYAWLESKDDVFDDASKKREEMLKQGKTNINLPEVKAEAGEKKTKDLDYKKMEERMVKVESDLAAVANVWGGSQQYADMHDQAKDILKMLKDHNSGKQPADPDFDEKLSDALLEFRDKTEKYFERKRGQGQKAANNKNSMKRINAASGASEFADKYIGKVEQKKEEAKKAQAGPKL